MEKAKNMSVQKVLLKNYGGKYMVQTFLLLIILIFLNAAFASAEIAVLSMNET